MASTLQNLFPFTENRAENFTVYPRSLVFSAPLQLGKYIFSDATTPAQKFGKLLQKEKGIIAGIGICANCSEEQFTKNVSGFLELQIYHDGNNTPVNHAPFYFSNFSQADIFQHQWEATGTTKNQEENFLLAINGEVDQIAGMVQNELQLKVVFNFIRVGTDKLKG